MAGRVANERMAELAEALADKLDNNQLSDIIDILEDPIMSLEFWKEICERVDLTEQE